MTRSFKQQSCFQRTGLAAALLAALGLALPTPLLHAQVHVPLPPQAPLRLPALGEAVNEDLNVGAERRLGEQVMREVRRDPDYLDDPQLLEYVQGLWRPLVQAARERGELTPEVDAQFAWETFLVRDRSVNAFALPGGFVGVYLGLVAITATRDELASVLAHELSHVTQRHIARSMASSQRQSMIGLAALLLGILAASRSSNPDAAQAAIVGGQAVAAQGQLNFSRDMEREADRIGYGVLTGAGFAGAGMVGMFDKMEAAYRLNDSGAFPYLRSHPLTSERVSEARSRLATVQPPRQSDLLLHSLMRARARVLMDDNVLALRRVQEQRATPAGASLAERAAAGYGAALASLKLRDWAAADIALANTREALQASSAAADATLHRALTLLQVQGLIERGAPGEALKLLAAQVNSPSAHDGRAALLLHAQAALALPRVPLAANELRQATEALQAWVTEHAQDASAWAALGQCAQALGLRLRAVRAQAEAQAALGDINGAITRLRSGQSLARSGAAGDFIEASVLDARLRQLQAQRLALQAEARGSRGSGPRGPDGDDGKAP